MMVETSDGTRVELLPNPTGGVGIYDSHDGSTSGTFKYSSTEVEIGQPLRYIHAGVTHILPCGEVINTLVWRQAA